MRTSTIWSFMHLWIQIMSSQQRSWIMCNDSVHCHHHYRQLSKSAKRIINLKTILSERNDSLWCQGKYNFLGEWTWNRRCSQWWLTRRLQFVQFYGSYENFQCQQVMNMYWQVLFFTLKLTAVNLKGNVKSKHQFLRGFSLCSSW